MPGAQGHITVRRAPKDGNPGEPGQDAINVVVGGENVILTDTSVAVEVTVTVCKGTTPISYYDAANPDKYPSFTCSTLSDSHYLFDNNVYWEYSVDDFYTFRYTLILVKKTDVKGTVPFTVNVRTSSGRVEYERNLHVSTVFDGNDGITMAISGNPMTMNQSSFTATSSWSKQATVTVYQGSTELTVTGMAINTGTNGVVTGSVSDGKGVITFTSSSDNYGAALLIAALFSSSSGIPFTVTFTDMQGAQRSLDGTVGISFVANGGKGDTGLDGCISRVSEWVEGVEYRNDEALTEGTRFLDIAVVSGSSPGEFSAYKCLQTHTASQSNKPPSSGNNSYWQKFNELAPVYTPLIMAEYAVFRFSQTNQLLVMKKEDATKVAAGMGGGDYPLWVGSETPSNAPFRVSYEGGLYAENAEVSGIIHSRLTYSSVKSIVGLSSYTINPQEEAFNTLFVTTIAVDTCWVYLPDADTYEGLELNIFQPIMTTMSVGSVRIATSNSNQNIYYSNSTSLINGVIVQTVSSVLTGGRNFKIIPNMIIRLIAVDGNWYVISGALTGE